MRRINHSVDRFFGSIAMKATIDAPKIKKLAVAIQNAADDIFILLKNNLKLNVLKF
jgi:CDP-diacylglycerol pyrophosphatase